MFDKFGEFDSAEEINAAAAGFLEEGDTESLFAMAEENGIDKEDVQDYIDGAVAELATPLMAAGGKLEKEAEALQTAGIIKDWKDYILQLCADNAEMAAAVRKKGKSLTVCMGELLKYSFENKVPVADEIAKAAGLRTPLYMGVPGRTEVKEIVSCYYMEAKK